MDSFFSNEVKNSNVIQSDSSLPAEMSVDIHNGNYSMSSLQDSVLTGEEVKLDTESESYFNILEECVALYNSCDPLNSTNSQSFGGSINALLFWEEVNSPYSMSNESSSVARIEHGIESVGEEEKYIIPFSE